MNTVKPDKELISSLRPKFTGADMENLKKYFEINKKYQDEINVAFRKDFETHPVFGPLMKMMPEDVQKQRNELSQKLLYNAIYNSDWDAYIEDLFIQGVVYAKMGITFSMWYEIVAVAKDYLTPYILKEHGHSPEETSGVLVAMTKLTDFAMQAIAESFMQEKNKIIAQHQEKQNELINELESFAYVVSHDLKSPLRGIAKVSEWLIDDYRDKLDANGVEQLQLMKNRVKRLDELIDGILSYSRLGREKEEKENISISELLKDVKGILLPPDYVTITSAANFPKVQFVRSKLMQVFSNLISNAIKYSDKSTCIINITWHETPTHYVISVRDNGPGIEKEYHEKVFGIFQTLQPKDEKESTGIGLAIVKKIIESEGGKIWIESEAGAGADFRFTILKS